MIGFLDQLVALDNDLKRFRDHQIPMRITLSTLKDLDLLPKPWNHEFWTKVMSEEEVEMRLVNIGEVFNPKSSSTYLSPSLLTYSHCQCQSPLIVDVDLPSSSDTDI